MLSTGDVDNIIFLEVVIMFKIPSSVRAALIRDRVCYTSRYKYVLHDATDLMPGLFFCDRFPMVYTGIPGVRAPQLEAGERAIF